MNRSVGLNGVGFNRWDSWLLESTQGDRSTLAGFNTQVKPIAKSSVIDVLSVRSRYACNHFDAQAVHQPGVD